MTYTKLIYKEYKCRCRQMTNKWAILVAQSPEDAATVYAEEMKLDDGAKVSILGSGMYTIKKFVTWEATKQKHQKAFDRIWNNRSKEEE